MTAIPLWIAAAVIPLTLAAGTAPVPPGPLAAAFERGTTTGLTDILRVETSVAPRLNGPFAAAEVRLRNLGAKEITAFTTSYRIVYPDGTERVVHGWGEDLVGFASSLQAVVGAAPAGSTLDTGEEIVRPLQLPLDTHGHPPVRLTVAVTMLIFADRTARGDRADVDLILRARARAAADLADAIEAGRRLLDGTDLAGSPEHINVQSSYLRVLTLLRKQGDRGRLDLFQRLWAARYQEELTHSSLVDGGYQQ
jgi:hypothetical protein